MVRRLIALLLLAALSGCAGPGPGPDADAPITLADLPAVDEATVDCQVAESRAESADHHARHLTLAIQIAGNAPGPGFTPSVQRLLVDAGQAGANVQVIRFAGRNGIEVGRVIPFASPSRRRDNRAADLAESLACLRGELARPFPAGMPDGVATLQALQVAGDTVPEGVPTTVVLVGGGVDTEAPLDLRVLRFVTPVARAVDDLRALGELPVLSDSDVVLSGLGQTAAPQPRLTQPDVAYVRDLWQAVVRAGGGRPLLDDDPLPDAARPADAPTAPVVPPSVVGQVPYLPDGCGGGRFIVPETLFDPRSSALRPGAEEQLRPAATALAPGSGRTADVVGHAHSVGDPAGELALSQDRALQVAETLVRLGADRSALSTVGRGAAEPRPGGTPADDRRVEIVITDTAC